MPEPWTTSASAVRGVHPLGHVLRLEGVVLTEYIQEGRSSPRNT